MTYWKDSLLVGVPAIDAEHRKLVKAIEELMEACTKGQGRATIEKTLNFVISYTKQHFGAEERIQAQYAYPGMAAHKQIHANFTATVEGLKKEFDQNGPSVALTASLNKNLVDWLIKHISVEDKKIGDHIRSKSGSA
ncbi:MAG: bacteriohemerythrin [Clostridiales bacterium]|nr:bacteriohemerythrin [Clostridiales bacterium]